MGEDRVNFYGKIAKFPNNTKASKAYNFLENIKANKKKLWYILIEKDHNGLQIIKYNNKLGFNLYEFVSKLQEHYTHNEQLMKYVSELKVVGEDKFSVITNIPDVEIDGKKLINILTSDLIKLLS